jgi:hypothetical protein
VAISKEDFSKSINTIRKKQGLRIGESKLFDDLYEASQEGSPLYESISQMDQPPICETVGDMRELITSEPERLLAVVHRVVGYVDAEHVALVDVTPEKGGNFSLLVKAGPGQDDLRDIKVDAMGYPVTSMPVDS